MICADYDNDGDTDVFICQMSRKTFSFAMTVMAGLKKLPFSWGPRSMPAATSWPTWPSIAATITAMAYWISLRLTSVARFPCSCGILARAPSEDVFRESPVADCFFAYVNWGCASSTSTTMGSGYLPGHGHTEDNIESVIRRHVGAQHRPRQSRQRAICRRGGAGRRRPSSGPGQPRFGRGRFGQRWGRGWGRAQFAGKVDHYPQLPERDAS